MQAALLGEVLHRRDRDLAEGLNQTSTVSPVDAEAIMSVISTELIYSLDDDWELTDYGRTVSALLADFNAARISEWP